MTKGIIFDLDGTLVDSAPDLHAISNEVLAAHGHGSLRLETVASFIGNGIPKLVKRCFNAVRAPIEGEAFDKALAMFIEKYEQAPAKLSTFYPGVPETLEALREQGYKIGICTNKTDHLAKLIVEQMGMDKYVDFVVGGDVIPEKKPAPEPLEYCAKNMGLELDQIVYVGDSETDAATARAAKVPFILFTEGYRKVLASDLYHQALYCRPTHLPHLVRHISAQPRA